MEQFLDAITINKTELKKHVAGDVVDKISARSKTPEPTLFTEFKDGVEFELDDVDDALGELVKQAVRVKAA
jgi:hypothetical protein